MIPRAPTPNDAQCRRCDDSGIVPERGAWRPCRCGAGAAVLDQLAERGGGH